MKKIITTFVMCISIGFSFAQVIDISTGVGTIGQIDPNWKVGTASPATNATYITAGINGIWENQPVAVTNAKWISLTTNNVGNGQTLYTYERSVNVMPTRNLLQCNFKVAADDELRSVELISPNNTVINLPFRLNGSYKFTNLINDVVKCPLAGKWTVRVKVFCGDPVGSGKVTAMLLSGNLNVQEGNCIEQPTLPPSTCCPPFNKDVLSKSMQYKGTGGISDPYTLVWNPSTLFQSQMQAYLNYIGLLNSCVTRMAMEFRLHNQGTGATPNMGGWGPMIGSIGYVSFTKNTTGVSTLSNLPAPLSFFPANGMVPNTWYAITTGMYHDDCGKSFFTLECAENTIYVRVQVMAGRSADGSTTQFLEISDGKKVIATTPIESSKTNAVKAGEGKG